jgi:hypothetical protein
MKMMTMLLLLGMVTFRANFGIAQSSKGYQEVTNWGKSVQGVQLSIAMTNNVVEPGTSIWVATVITNTSTNAVRVIQTGRETDYDLLLANRTGKTYNLTPKFALGSRSRLFINPGKGYSLTIPVTIASNIASGDYALTASRHFYLSNLDLKLESNPLRVEVRQKADGAALQ